MAQETDNPRRRIMAMFNQPPGKPDWSAWKKITNAPLWEVVALSCEIEPSDIRGWKLGISRYKPPRAFIDRLRHAEAMLSTNGGGLRCTPEGDGSMMARVALGNFRAWMELEGFSLPHGFPNFPASNPPREDPAARALRLTLRIEEVKKQRTDFMAYVAEEESISIPRLQKIVGTVTDRKKRLANLHKDEVASTPQSQ